MRSKPSVGIVGANGDLGSKLTAQAMSSFDQVYVFDVVDAKSRGTSGVDPQLTPKRSNEAIKIKSLDELIETCDVIHWAAPIKTVADVGLLPKGDLLILHDSVMANSVAAAKKLAKKKAIEGQIAVAHCLMNNERSVAVAADIGGSKQLIDHISQLGLRPVPMTHRDHDYVMAHSQGLWAVICKVFKPQLEDYKRRGLLIPSGQRFLDAIHDNESHWTSISYAAITSNPQLQTAAKSIHKKIKNNQHR